MMRFEDLFESLTNDHCTFLHTDDVRHTYKYFRFFVTMHLAVNQGMILMYPNNTHWQDVLEENVKVYVKYGRIAIKKEARHGRNISQEIQIDNWIQQLEPYKRASLVDTRQVKNGRAVSFRRLVGMWLSCQDAGAPGATCTARGCPGDNNPMERGPEFPSYYRCYGEVFRIHAVDQTPNGTINSCSRIALASSKNDNNGRMLWLGTRQQPGPLYARSHTTLCQGDVASMKNGGCPDEVWRITARDRTCAEPIKDRDVVTLRSVAHDRWPIRCTDTYTIFRSDVNADDNIDIDDDCVYKR